MACFSSLVKLGLSPVVPTGTTPRDFSAGNNVVSFFCLLLTLREHDGKKFDKWTCPIERERERSTHVAITLSESTTYMGMY